MKPSASIYECANEVSLDMGAANGAEPLGFSWSLDQLPSVAQKKGMDWFLHPD